MIDLVTLRVRDRDAAERFYTAVLPALGIDSTHRDDELIQWDDFAVAPAGAEHDPTEGLHVAFAAPSREAVDRFWQAGVDAGHREDGPPGERGYVPGYYGAFLLDPQGNSVEAVHHEALRTGGNVDHLWIRVADLGASKRFYEVIAPHVGLTRGTDTHERVSFRGGSGSVSLVAGTPSRNVHVAFPASDGAAVDAFHAAAIGAGYRDSSAPGIRADYGEGYYAAYVLDPDHNSVGAVNHAE